jgi:nucleoid DNA-binding protein
MTVMAKKEIVAYVAEKAKLSKKDAEAAVNAVFEGITEALKTNGKIQLVGFGSFEVKERAKRMGKNPATGETIEIPASKVLSFKAGKSLNEAIKKS